MLNVVTLNSQNSQNSLDLEMSIHTSHAPGTFCWMDMGTTDTEAAKAFYTELFGWTYNEWPMGPTDFYTMFQKNGKNVAALFKQREEFLKPGVPPYWNSYIAVANVDEAAKRAADLGATEMMPPMDVFDSGRMVFLADPCGAHVALWQAKSHIGFELTGEPGSLGWSELSVKADPDKAKAFYSGLLGWTHREMDMGNGMYTLFSHEGKDIAGIMINEPSGWMSYIMVEDAKVSVPKAVSLGGKVVIGPSPIPGIGNFAILVDPLGAAFSILDSIK